METLFFLILLEYSRFKMLCLFQRYNKVSDLVIHIHILILLPILNPYRLFQNTEFHVLYGRFLLVSYFIHSNVCMLIPCA